MGPRTKQLVFNSVLNFRRVTHFQLGLLEMQVTTVQHSAVQLNVVQVVAVQCSAVQYTALQ